jgi:hypothetical protein
MDLPAFRYGQTGCDPTMCGLTGAPTTGSRSSRRVGTHVCLAQVAVAAGVRWSIGAHVKHDARFTRGPVVDTT